MIPIAAHAALDIPISGTTWSEEDAWYTSSNYRTVTTDDDGFIEVDIDSYPKLSNGSNDELKWRIVVGGTESSVTYLYQVHGWDVVDFQEPGTQFRNEYARYSTCYYCDDDFSGNMNY